MKKHFSRRSFLQTAAAAAAGLALAKPGYITAAAEKPAAKAKKRVLRFCHLSDIHLYDQRQAAKGLAKALEHVNRQSPKPDMIITGGDNIFDAYSSTEQSVKAQFELLKKVMKDNTDIYTKYCLGNHDIWGWDKNNSKTSGEEGGWGYAWAAMELELDDGPYYSFDAGGWRFAILNSTFAHPYREGQYIGRLDEKQFAWLKGLIEGTPQDMPVLIISHIPILTACDYEKIRSEKSEPVDIVISGSAIHVDGPPLLRLFNEQGAKVKLCLSGHHHRVDRIDYMDVIYICDGAVSGAWWKGPNKDCDEGYGLIDLYSDGTFEHQYVQFGWTAGI